MTFVETENWVTKTAELKAERFEILIAVDQIKSNKIELHLLTQKHSHIYTTISRDETQIAPSIANVFPAASWSEREIAEGFGIQFDNQESNQPLLLTNSAALAKSPMRRDTLLKQRNEIIWPGAKEPNNEKASPTRRKSFPIGAVENPEKTV
jgi:NADH-quinone oxidoreductase subunit C